MGETPLRRHLQPQAGEGLLLAMVALDVPYRAQEFAEISGLPPSSIYSSPLVTISLPRYGQEEDRRRMWRGLNPALLWHPLFWLPPRVADRYEIHDPATGQYTLEDDDTWAVRVALEVSACGLYDQSDGSWLDILALVGIDITTVEGVQRVANWLAGARDEAIDSIDLSEMMDNEDDPDWAIRAATALMPQIRGASAACIASSLHDMIDADTAYTTPARTVLARLARALLPEDAGDLPADIDSKSTAMLKLTRIATRFEPDFITLLAIDSESVGMPAPDELDLDELDDLEDDVVPLDDHGLAETLDGIGSHAPAPLQRQARW